MARAGFRRVDGVQRLALTLVACVACATARPSSASDALPVLHIGAWTAEQFGSDVAVLRGSSDPAGARNPGGSLLLSCSGSDRRFRLTLPYIVSQAAQRGDALVSPVGAPDRTRSIVSFKLETPTTILGATAATPSGDFASTIGRMLLTRPRALDIVLSLGSGPVLFTRLKVVRLLLSLSPADVDAATRFVNACGRYPAARAN